MQTNQMDYSVSFYFKLSFNGEELTFLEVSGIGNVSNLTDETEGGLNQFLYLQPKKSNFSNLVLKRGLVSKSAQFFQWCNNILNEGLSVPITTHTISVSLVAADGSVIREWTFFNAYPVALKLGALKSDDQHISIENVELAYTKFEVANH